MLVIFGFLYKVATYIKGFIIIMKVFNIFVTKLTYF